MAGEEEGEPWRRLVVMLQASVRGYLIRKKFQSLRGAYESIVKEIEGNLDSLQWNRHSLSWPAFLPKPIHNPVKTKELKGQEAACNESTSYREEEKRCQEELLPAEESCCEMQLPSHLPTKLVIEDEAGDMIQNLKHLVEKPSGNPSSLPGQREEGGDLSNVSSEWSSVVLEVESPRLSQELSFQKGQEVPQAIPDLQRYRKHLAMELLWLQQAIVSRKNYLMLKQRLGSSE
ncbi:IQ domain-containing protein C [Varanus komodoensis]|uniref:IQ domain-containing protein C n=1 Tax=Varanus komodoensis TaxID=61221 RepID=UPI001CF7BF04|nr:IQ domain-containing protein C [Varanus komodoensis]